MFRSAHSIRRTPSPARARSLTSCLRVVAISPLLLSIQSCNKKPFMLALLPVERVHAAAVEPRVQRGPQLGLASKTVRERDLADVDVEAAPELPQRPELVELTQAVLAVAGTGSPRHDEPRGLQVPEHPRRPAGRVRCFADAHGETLPQVCQGSTRPYRSSSRTTSSSCGVETSMIVVSSSALTRWIVPGRIRNAAPGPTISEFGILSPGAPISI